MINKIVIIGLVIFQFLLLHRINDFPIDPESQNLKNISSDEMDIYQNDILNIYDDEPVVINNNIYNYNFNLFQFHYHCDNNDSCSFKPYSSNINESDDPNGLNVPFIFSQILPPGRQVITDSNFNPNTDWCDNDSCIIYPNIIQPIVQPYPQPQNHNIAVNLTVNRYHHSRPHPSIKKSFWNNFTVLLYFTPIVGIILIIAFCS